MTIFQKSNQSFLRIEFSDDKNVYQKFLRPYNQPMPAKIVIQTDEYKRFGNITVQTKVGFQDYEIDDFDDQNTTVS